MSNLFCALGLSMGLVLAANVARGQSNLDNNPTNPSNYLVSPPVLDGKDFGEKYWLQNGQVQYQCTTHIWGTAWGPNDLHISNNQSGRSQTITYSSKGKYTWYVYWCGQDLSAAPDHIIVKVNGSAAGGGGPGTTVTVSDGLYDTPVAAGLGKVCTGTTYRKLKMVGGVATTSLDVSAVSTATNMGGAQNAGAAASLEVADRDICAFAYDYPVTYKKQLLEGASNIVTYRFGSYQKAVPVVNGTDNFAPTRLYDRVDFVLEQFLAPLTGTSQDTQYLHLGGKAAPPTVTASTFYSHYQWSKGTAPLLSGQIPNMDVFGHVSYDIPDISTSFQKFSVNSKDPVIAPGSISPGDAGIVDIERLAYTWNDGISLEYSLALWPHLPVENHQQYGTEQDAASIHIGDYKALSEWVPNNLLTTTFTVPLQTADFRAGAKTAQLVGSVSKELTVDPIKKLVLVFLNGLLGFTPAPTTDSRQRNNLTDPNFGWAMSQCAAGNSDWIDVLPSVDNQTTEHEYDWQVMQQPQYETDWYVVDLYGPNGYTGQDDAQLIMWQYSFQEHWRYRLHLPPTPYGGGL